MLDILCMLAVWRISSLLVSEAGPFDIFSRLRFAFGVRYDEQSECVATGLAQGLCCLWCCSLWVSAVTTLALSFWHVETLFEAVIDWLAFSAGSLVVESVVHHANVVDR